MEIRCHDEDNCSKKVAWKFMKAVLIFSVSERTPFPRMGERSLQWLPNLPPRPYTVMLQR